MFFSYYSKHIQNKNMWKKIGINGDFVDFFEYLLKKQEQVHFCVYISKRFVIFYGLTQMTL